MYARVTCGYAAVSDVRTNKHDDTMDSFVLSETFKYLFLLFAEPNELVLDLDEFIFTTEGHLLPLTLAAVRTNLTAVSFVSPMGEQKFPIFFVDLRMIVLISNTGFGQRHRSS